MVQLSTSWQLLNSTTLTYYSSFSGTFQLWAKYSTQEVANNRTKVHYSWDLVLNSGWITSYDAQDYVTNSGWNDATYREYTSSKTLRTWEGWISHNANGTGSGSCTGRTRMGGMGLDTGDVSASYTLPTIPRASKPTASPNPLTIGSSGATLTVNTNRKSSSFTHTIKVQCGSWSWTSSARAVGASTTVTVPYSVIAQFSATSKTASATVTCTTFSGTTQIGSAQTCSVTFQVNASVDHPNIGTITVQDTNARTSAVTQDDSIYIANISTLQATIPLTVSGSYTELAQAVVTCGNKSQTYTLSGTSASLTFEFDKVNASSLSVTVKDKRGNSVTGTKSWTLIAYQPVTAVATVGRPSATGSVGVGQLTGMAYGGNFGATQNSLSISIDFKLHDAPDYDPQGTETATLALGQSGYNSYTDAFTFNYTLDYQYQYDIKFTVSDLFSTATYVAQLMQGLPIISWDENEVDVFGNLHIHDRDNPTVWQDVMQGFDAVQEHNGDKNLIPLIPNNVTYTTNGITFVTDMYHGTVTANGTATSNATLVVWTTALPDYEGFIFTGCPSGGGDSTYFMAIEESGGNYQIFGRDNGEGGVLTGQGDAICNVYIRINPNVTVNNLVFRPMLRDSRIASPTFSPYSAGLGFLGHCLFAYVDNHGNQPITTSTGGEVVMASRTIPYLPTGRYLLVGGGSLYCNTNTAYFKFAFYKNGTRFINNRIYVTNITSNTNVVTGMAIRVVNEPATNVRIDYILGAQSGAIGYSKSYNTRWGFIFKIADNSSVAHID